MISSILNGQNFSVNRYPESGVKEPGYYYNQANASIEHWSKPCSYTAAMAPHATNAHGMICDGFQSILGIDDADHLINKMQIWNEHLKRYGVIQ